MTQSAQSTPNPAAWTPDHLGPGYQQLVLELGPDPDGEGDIVATLIRYRPENHAAHRPPGAAAVLYVHGYTDYFFQTHVAEHFAALGYEFFALDLHKCGRSLRPGQTPHYVSDLALYDNELELALNIVREQVDGGSVLLMAHSTGGLILPLWLDRLGRREGGSAKAGVAGLILNSPWFDLQGPSVARNIGTAVINVVGRFRGKTAIPRKRLDTYGASLHASANGEWHYQLDWKPLDGFPVRFGWLRAVRAGHTQLHRGLDVGVPALILRSKLTRFTSDGPDVDLADAVLDVRQIQRWSGCLGDRTTIVPVDGARHDVFLSTPGPLAQAFGELDRWLESLGPLPAS
ncbi:alpha/beta hydrolase [Skermania sp. ID1734]|nr:alpha/beta hydrolase [Skermania sp. ID1734]TSD93548.1 alpha/beta hydrolase [Skermania sp. ID1734]